MALQRWSELSNHPASICWSARLPCYCGATVIVNHFSDFTYVHLMKEMNAASTVTLKQAFEHVASTHRVMIRYYHTDNGHLFKEAVNSAGQSLTFCGVNPHHQNGRAECRIHGITVGARTSLLHTAHHWPEAIDAALWPVTLKLYTNLRNALPTTFEPEHHIGRSLSPTSYHSSPTSLFSGTTVDMNLNDFHPFGALVLSLKNNCNIRWLITNGGIAVEWASFSCTLLITPPILHSF